MTHRAPHPTHLRNTKRSSGWWRFALVACLSAATTANAPAQVLVGGNRPPSVSVDLTVLDQLGTAPNLPQLFGASRPSSGGEATPPATILRPAPRPVPPEATLGAASGKPNHLATTRTAQRKPRPTATRVAKAPDRPVHLVPPAGPVAGGPRVGPAIQPASVAVDSPVPPPAPMPKLPQAGEVPPPPAVGSAPAHDEPPPVSASQQPPLPRANDAPVPLTAAASPPSPGPAPAPAPSSAPAAASTQSTPAPAAAPVQIASAAGAGAIVNTVKFASGLTDLPAGSQSVLNTVAGKLLGDDALRVQLVAHATGTADQAMEARRVSLARAVAVRAYLMDKGVRSLRIDVRALGNRAVDGPASDQVDLLLISQ